MGKHKWILLVLLVLMAILLNFFGDGSWGPVTFVQDAAIEILSPFQSFLTGIHGRLSSHWSFIQRIGSQELIIHELQEQLLEQERQLIMAESFRQENVRLRRLLHFPHRTPHMFHGAQVIARSGDERSRWVLINVGSLDGIEEKMPVITYHGILLGIVDTVSWNTAQVLLINDPEFAVGGLVQRVQSRDIGVVKGQLEDDRILLMENLAWDADIVEGDLIVTSGLSPHFPREIPIGYVIHVEQEDYGLAQKAYLQTPTRLHRVEEVLVLMTETHVRYPERGDILP